MLSLLLATCVARGQPAANLTADQTRPHERESKPDTTEDDAFIAELRRLYGEGMRRVEAGDHVDPEFWKIVARAHRYQNGHRLFEQRPDGRWQYRKDEFTELYALAAFRDAVWLACDPSREDREDNETQAAGEFCMAVEARPDLILPLAKQARLGRRAQRLFNRALRNHDPVHRYQGFTCYVKGGWTSIDSTQPGFGDPVDILDAK